MTPTPAPPRPYPYAPFLLAAIAGVLALVALVALLWTVGAASVAVLHGGLAFLIVIALPLGVLTLTFFLTVDRMLARRGVRPLTWPQGWGGLGRGSLLVLLIEPLLVPVMVSAIVAVAVTDAPETVTVDAEGFLSDTTRADATYLATIVTGLLVAPPLFALGTWSRARRDRPAASKGALRV